MTNAMMGLTKRQLQCYQEIVKFYRQHNIMPTVRELVELLGSRSNSTVLRLLNGLEQRGYIERTPYLNRAIRLLKMDTLILVDLQEQSDKAKALANFLYSLKDGEKAMCLPVLRAWLEQHDKPAAEQCLKQAGAGQ